MRAKSPHLVKLAGVDPLGVVLPLKFVSLFLSPFRVVGADSCASLFNAFASTGNRRGVGDSNSLFNRYPMISWLRA